MVVLYPRDAPNPDVLGEAVPGKAVRLDEDVDHGDVFGCQAGSLPGAAFPWLPPSKAGSLEEVRFGSCLKSN